MSQEKEVPKTNSQEKRLIEDLIRALSQKVGNKVYMRDLEKLLKEKLNDLSPMDKETILFLTRDIKFLK